MSSKKTREVLHTQARTIVASVIEYFNLEKNNMGPIIDVRKVLERVASACKVPYRTVRRINSELKEAVKDDGGEDGASSRLETATDDIEEEEAPIAKKSRTIIRTPRKNRESHNCSVTNLDDFQKSAIHRHILAYYERKEVPTLRKLLVSLKDADLFHGSRWSLSQVIKSIGFVYKKFNSRKCLMEKPSVALLRCQFLRKIHNVDMNKIVFLDETWLNANSTKDKGWTDNTVKGTLSTPLGKGKRLIICHAGGQQGWINAPPLVFESKKTCDYHEEMNSEVFEAWFFEVLIPAIPRGSVIVMDNAPYHSRIKDKAPNSSTTKGEMVKWLQEKGIIFNADLRKWEIYEIVKLHKPPQPKYDIDARAAELGFTVIRLPPYHCQYNPIEMVWGYLKAYVKDRNKTFKLTDVQNLFMEAISTVTPEQWKKYVQHVKKSIDADWSSEGLNDISVQDFIINLCPDDSEEESDCDDDSDGELDVFPLE